MGNRQDEHSDAGRRKFLKALGSGAAVLGAGTGFARDDDEDNDRRGQQRFVIREDRFGRMFPQLRGFAEPSSRLEAALLEIGKPDGMMAPKRLDPNDPDSDDNNVDNPRLTAGFTFFGQFMDHDMTFDLDSRLAVPTEPVRVPNARNPTFDLDTVFGGGPLRSPELYEARVRGRNGGTARDPLAPFRLRIESGGKFEDVPRTSLGTAIIGDPRNDENMMISGLQAATIKFHNNLLDMIATQRRRDEPEDVFRRARRLTQWHYQWLIVNRYLPMTLGESVVNSILTRGRRFYRPRVPFMPVEFAVAAFRFGHSQVRPAYRANLAGNADNSAFAAPIFDITQDPQTDPEDLRGGRRAPRRFIGWQSFFNFGDGQARQNKMIDTVLSPPLFVLPRQTIAGPGGPNSLPQRNLLRHLTFALPSGQSIAREMGVAPLTRADLNVLTPLGNNLDQATPLWFYILKEAEVAAKGMTLGPVGARIIGEVIIGLLQLDRDSFLTAAPNFRPTVPNRLGQVGGDFDFADYLNFAGVGPAQRGQ